MINVPAMRILKNLRCRKVFKRSIRHCEAEKERLLDYILRKASIKSV
jgi:hypothetical protein